MTGRLKRRATVLRAIATAGILAFLALSPKWLLAQLARQRYVEFLEKPPAEWHGQITLWHIADFRVYQGSVTDYLQARADAYCKRHTGVHIDVLGLTVKRYNDRIQRGEFPDMYSFPSGLMYCEQLGAIDPALPKFRGALAPAGADKVIYAVPYLTSGYLLAINTALATKYRLELPGSEGADLEPVVALFQSALAADAKTPQLHMPPVLAARMGLVGTLATLEQFQSGQTALAVLDARTYGDLIRSQKTNLPLEAVPVTNYTEAVQYLAAARGVDETRAGIIADFIAYLLSDGEQQRLSSLGALPVTALETAPEYTDEQLEKLYEAYESPAVPEPFAYQRHREQLVEEATAALTGDAGSRVSFSERMQVVENGIL